MFVKPVKTRIFKEKENLLAFILQYLKKPKDGSVIVVTSKIVALAEGRTTVPKDEATKVQLIQEESEVAIETKYVWLTLKDGMLMASAGIDESNANGKLILLPKDSYRAAHVLRRQLRQKWGLKNLGVLITDSRTMPLRAGVTGVALGYAGFRGVRDYRGKPDIFNRAFKFSRTDVADSLAAAAVLVMGEGSERYPLAVIEKAPIDFCSVVDGKELCIDLKDDMYEPLFPRIFKR